MSNFPSSGRIKKFSHFSVKSEKTNLHIVNKFVAVIQWLISVATLDGEIFVTAFTPSFQ